MIFTAQRRPSECVASDRKRQQRMVCLVSCEKGLFNLFFTFGFQNHEVTVRGILQHSHFKLKCFFLSLSKYQSRQHPIIGNSSDVSRKIVEILEDHKIMLKIQRNNKTEATFIPDVFQSDGSFVSDLKKQCLIANKAIKVPVVNSIVRGSRCAVERFNGRKCT